MSNQHGLRVVLTSGDLYAVLARLKPFGKGESIFSVPQPGSWQLFKITYHKDGAVNFRSLGEEYDYVRLYSPPPSQLVDNIRLGGFSCPESSLGWVKGELPTRYKCEQTIVIDVEELGEIPVFAVDAWVSGADASPSAIVGRYTNHQAVIACLADSSKPRLSLIVWTLVSEAWAEVTAIGLADKVRSITFRSNHDDLVIGYTGEHDLINGVVRTRVDFAKRSADGKWTVGIAADAGGDRNYAVSHQVSHDDDVRMCVFTDYAEEKKVKIFPDIP